MELPDRELSAEEAAGRLFVSPETVRVHASNVVEELQERDREGAPAILRGGWAPVRRKALHLNVYCAEHSVS